MRRPDECAAYSNEQRRNHAMRKLVLLLLVAGAAAVAVAIAIGRAPAAGNASSHREAPLISEDPSADNTDLYAFRSPDKPDTVTIISNWIPAEDPAAGPNWYTFSQSARYLIHIDTNGDGQDDVTYRYRFVTQPGVAFLRNTQQLYEVTKTDSRGTRVVGNGLLTPPNNIGPRSTPNYRKYVTDQEHLLTDGELTFAGQREDGFFGDIGSIFDLVAIREGTGATGGGKDFFAGYNVHAIALRIPIAMLDNGTNHTIGVWASTERPSADGTFKQVSRLGFPLVNEVLIPTDRKDEWNASPPAADAQWRQYYETPILAALLGQLYPQFGPYPTTGRSDLVAVGLTGVPGLNFTGSPLVDELRLNMSIQPAASPNRMGVLGGDTAGFPNGRRLGDDVIDIAEQVVAGALVGHPLPLGDGVDANEKPHLGVFPYEGDPYPGFENAKGTTYPKKTLAAQKKASAKKKVSTRKTSASARRAR
jgi:hypothetical protein